MNISGSTEIENKIIDSLNYLQIHPNIKSLTNEIKNTSEKLTKKGFLDHEITQTLKINDSTYRTIINLKNRITKIHIYIGRNNSFSNFEKFKNDSLIIPYDEIETFLAKRITEAENRGFTLSKVKLENIQRKNSIIYADLNFKSEKKRNLNSIILNYTNESKSDFFPKSHLKQLNKKYLNKTFNQNIVKQLYDDINNFEFISQTKYPEILLTKDSTKIYTYVEKRKNNNFDGYIGFSNNDKDKIRLNGYLDITLQNILHSGEQFSLYWKNDGNQQTTFNTKIELPYIFQSSLGIKAQLNIFKQDSTFQNTKTAIDLGYYLNYNSKIYIGYQSTESSDIQNINNSALSDFKNTFTTLSLDYKKNDSENSFFSKKAYLNFLVGFGKRKTNNDINTAGTSNQFNINLNAAYNFELNDKNFINIASQNLYLKSKNYISNELFRFGGINSIRGFLENSLQANYSSSILTEYRYLFSKSVYAHTVADYAIYQDLTNISNPQKIKKLIGIGIGTGIQTKSGFLRIILTNGVENQQEIQLYNTIVNICYNVKF